MVGNHLGQFEYDQVPQFIGMRGHLVRVAINRTHAIFGTAKFFDRRDRRDCTQRAGDFKYLLIETFPILSRVDDKC